MSDIEGAQALTRELQQEVVDSVVRDHLGHAEDEIRESLQVRFAARGLAVPPDTWLTNVALTIHQGQTYVVGSYSHVVAEGRPVDRPAMSEQHSPLTTEPPEPPARGA
jgi:hypothetical protein